MSADFNVDFSKDTQYDRQTNVRSILWGAGGPVLETELNEMQYIQEEKLKSVLKTIYKQNGLLGFGTLSFENGKVVIENEYAIIDGDLIFIDHLELTPTQNGSIYINTWKEVVSIHTPSLYKYGNVQGTEIKNYILDYRYDAEITRRMVLNYNLVEEKDLVEGGVKLEVGTISTNELTSEKEFTQTIEIVSVVSDRITNEEIDNLWDSLDEDDSLDA